MKDDLEMKSSLVQIWHFIVKVQYIIPLGWVMVDFVRKDSQIYLQQNITKIHIFLQQEDGYLSFNYILFQEGASQKRVNLSRYIV